MTRQHVKSDRIHERQPFEEQITVRFQAEPVTGSGKNISRAGVYFIADTEVRVTVTIGGREVSGQLVRVENHGQGRTGMAVKFEQDVLPVVVD
ncbi:MAG: hypothetical protein KDC87_19265 [Planctomycetes bacterium]|nr:hypothetical protein [Planctomycetota bacterium]MCB9871854.1 hypothetical protein [Planctomycetota bacterium]